MFDDGEMDKKEQARRLLALWRLALTTPAIYMAVGLIVGQTVFSAQEEPGLISLESGARSGLLLGFLMVGGLLLTGILWLRQKRLAFFETDFSVYRARCFWMFVLCDTIAFSGLCLYLIDGDAVGQGLMSLLAWLGYAISRPLTLRQE